MKPSPFRLVQPRTTEALCLALARYGESARILAGGQSLVPMMNFRLVAPEVLIDINRVEGLDYIRLDGDRVVIGAMTRHATVEASELVASRVPLVRLAYRYIAHTTIRNRGTIGGNLSHADPGSELPAVAICLGAEFVVRSTEGERTVAAADFFQGMFEVDVRPGEFLAAIRFPVAGAGQRFGFEEFSPRHGDLASALVAVALQMEGEVCVSAAVVHGAVEEKPGHVTDAEEILRGSRLDADVIASAAEAAGRIEPTLESYHADAAFKKDLLRTLTARAVARAAKENAG